MNEKLNKFSLMQSKSIFALKAVNLQNLSERSKNDLIKEIVFLEKLKNCNGVVKVNSKISFEDLNNHTFFLGF